MDDHLKNILKKTMPINEKLGTIIVLKKN